MLKMRQLSQFLNCNVRQLGEFKGVTVFPTSLVTHLIILKTISLKLSG